MKLTADFLVIGTGIAGLSYALKVADKGSVLLVTNHGTTAEEKDAWNTVAERFGQKINVWDISLNNALSLSEERQGGENLLRDFHGKTIILTNGAFKTLHGQRHGDQLLSQMDLIRAAESHGIRILVVNEEGHDVRPLFEDRLIPTDGRPRDVGDSVKLWMGRSRGT